MMGFIKKYFTCCFKQQKPYIFMEREIQLMNKREVKSYCYTTEDLELDYYSDEDYLFLKTHL